MLAPDFREIVVFDLRTEEEVKVRQQFPGREFFKTDLDICEEKPKVIASEEVQSDVIVDQSDHPVWKPNSIVYNLPKQGQIVHIVSESGLTKFFFHDAQPPFTKLQ